MRMHVLCERYLYSKGFINLVEIVDTKNLMKCLATVLINIREIRIIYLCILLFYIGMTVDCCLVSLFDRKG